MCLRVRLAHRKTGFSPPANYFTYRSKAGLLIWIINVISVLFFVMLSCASVERCLVVKCWERAAVMSNCEVVTFPLVSWVRCCACLYGSLFSFLLKFKHQLPFECAQLQFCPVFTKEQAGPSHYKVLIRG